MRQGVARHALRASFPKRVPAVAHRCQLTPETEVVRVVREPAPKLCLTCDHSCHHYSYCLGRYLNFSLSRLAEQRVEILVAPWETGLWDV